MTLRKLMKMRILSSVEGMVKKYNDIIFQESTQEAVGKKKIICFFGGDVQDLRQNMIDGRKNVHYINWCLEKMTELLSSRFPESDIYIIRASRFSSKTFACYDNMVIGDSLGAPKHSFDCHSLNHLNQLLINANKQLNVEKGFSEHEKSFNEEKKSSSENKKSSREDEEKGFSEHEKSLNQEEKSSREDKKSSREDEEKSFSEEKKSLNEDEPQMILIGFSKGCVVLNQILYSFFASQNDPHLKQFVKRVEAMFWLDGGHSGGANTWVTAGPVLQYFASLNIKVYIHVTPYQVKCSLRPWIGKEENIFYETLTHLGVKIERVLHFNDDEPSLDNHFKVLEAFMPPKE